MKTLTKKCGIAAAAALLILSVMLVTGCTGPETGGGYTPPPGMGAVQLNFNKTIGRTILPGTVTSPADFDHFTITYTDKTTTTTKGPFSVGDGDIIPLLPDDYKFIVLAYLESGDTTGDEAASWESDPLGLTYSITVDAALVPLDVKLKGVVTALSTGKFKWNITTTGITTQINKIDMTIEKIGGPSTWDATYDLLQGAGTGSTGFTTYGKNNTGGAGHTLGTGFYFIDFNLAVEDFDDPTPNTATIAFRQVLHIYANMISTFTYAFKDDFFGITGSSIEVAMDYEDRGTPIQLTYEIDSNGPSVLVEDAVIQVVRDSEVLTITVTNSDAFDTLVTDISWHFDSSLPAGKSTSLAITNAEDILTITPAAGTEKKAYIISVVCIDAAGEPSGIRFIVLVKD